MKRQPSKHTQTAERASARTATPASAMRDKPLVTILMCFCYSLPLAYAVLSRLLQQPMPLRVAGFVLAFTLLWTLITYSRRIFALFSLSAVGLILLLLLIQYLSLNLKGFLLGIWDWIVAFLDEMWWESIPLANYGGFLTGLMTGIITLYAVICSKKPHILALGLMGVGVYCWEWYNGFDNNLALMVLFLATMAGFYLKTVHIRLYFRARIDHNSKLYPLAVLPLCLILAVVSVMMPAVLPLRQPINLIGQLDITQMDSIADLWAAIRAPSEFQFYRTGFSDRNGKIGGNVSLNKAPVMEVFSPWEGGPLYLAGSYRDTYQDNGWKNTIEQEIVENYHYWKDKEKMYWLEYLGQPQSFRTVTIQPIHRQRVLFTPQNWINIDSDFTYTRKPSDALLVEQTYKSGYTVAFHANEAIQGTPIPVTYYQKGFYQQYPALMSSVYGSGLSPQPTQELDALSRYADSIRSHYLQLPDDLPERVKTLAKNVASKYQVEGDLLKAWAIMEHLSSYQYTLTPGPVPKGRDLVDYFLFDHKEGYCTYYATAMVIMCRSVGIPARYVEGYAVEDLRSHNLITNEQAHTWVEIYLEGYGWYMMDPTTAARRAHGSNPTAPPRGTTAPLPETTVPTQDTTQPTAPTTMPTQTPSTITPPAPDNRHDWVYPLMWTVLGVLAALAAGAAPYFIRKSRLKTLDQAPPAERIKGYFSLLLELLRIDGVAVSSSDTALSLGKRLNSQYTFDGVGFYQIACLYCRYAYSDLSGISEQQAEEDSQTIRQYYHALYQRVRKNLGLRWIFRLYFQCR